MNRIKRESESPTATSILKRLEALELSNKQKDKAISSLRTENQALRSATLARDDASSSSLHSSTSKSTPKAPQTPVRASPKERIATIKINAKKVKQKYHDLREVQWEDEEYKEMKNAAVLFCQILLGRPNATSPIPDPPTPVEKEALESRYPTNAELPTKHSNYILPRKPTLLKQKYINDNFHDYILSLMRRWGILRFTFDWNGNFDDRYNQVMLQFFIRTFCQGSLSGQFGTLVQTGDRDILVLTSMIGLHWITLCGQYTAQQKNPFALKKSRADGTIQKAKERARDIHLNLLGNAGVHPDIVAIFRSPQVMPEEHLVSVPTNVGPRVHRECRPHQWWSEKALAFMIFLEQAIAADTLMAKSKGPPRQPRVYTRDVTAALTSIPFGLPIDFISKDFLAAMPHYRRKDLLLRPAVLPDDFSEIFPKDDDDEHSFDLEDYTELQAAGSDGEDVDNSSGTESEMMYEEDVKPDPEEEEEAWEDELRVKEEPMEEVL
ncbi:hypothetical protein P7C70_g8438, partial [Phenoliferia sp. Uapishka_3]